MEIRYGFCAKFAEVGSDGTFAVIGGGLVSIFPSQLPGILPTLALVMHLAASEKECHGGQRLRVELFGPGETRLPLEAEFGVPPINVPEAEQGHGGTFSCALSIASVGIPAAGRYEFRVSADGRPLGVAAAFDVRQPPAAPGGQT